MIAYRLMIDRFYIITANRNIIRKIVRFALQSRSWALYLLRIDSQLDRGKISLIVTLTSLMMRNRYRFRNSAILSGAIDICQRRSRGIFGLSGLSPFAGFMWRESYDAISLV